MCLTGVLCGMWESSYSFISFADRECLPLVSISVDLIANSKLTHDCVHLSLVHPPSPPVSRVFCMLATLNENPKTHTRSEKKNIYEKLSISRKHNSETMFKSLKRLESSSKKCLGEKNFICWHFSLISSRCLNLFSLKSPPTHIPFIRLLYLSTHSTLQQDDAKKAAKILSDFSQLKICGQNRNGEFQKLEVR